MNLHLFKYSILVPFRTKSDVFWILLFPILLGIMFHVAFSNMASSDAISTLPIAVVSEDEAATDALKDVLQSVTISDDEDLFDVSYCNRDEALDLLEDNKIDAIITVGTQLSLEMSANMKNESINQSIIQNFVSTYNLNADAITSIAKEHPENLETILSQLDMNYDFRENVSYSKGNQDSFTQFFYSLIAMSCMFSGMGGLSVALNNQGNLSDLAMRKNISPTNKMVGIVAELTAVTLFQAACTCIGFLFMRFVLKVDFGDQLWLALLAILVSSFTTVSAGFCLGSVGTVKREIKEGVIILGSMICCFFSGLMIGGMRIIVQENCPIFNRINPAALISDCFYSLSVYNTYDRYITNLISLLILGAIFCIGGFLFTRRKKYASL